MRRRIGHFAALLLFILVGCQWHNDRRGASFPAASSRAVIPLDRAVKLALGVLRDKIPRGATGYWMKAKRTVDGDGWMLTFFLISKSMPANENYYIPGGDITVWVRDSGKTEHAIGF